MKMFGWEGTPTPEQYAEFVEIFEKGRGA